MYLHDVLSGRLSVTDRGRYVHAPALPQAFYPVIECTGLDVVRYAPLVIGHAAGPAFHDQAVLFVSGDSSCSHCLSSIIS